MDGAVSEAAAVAERTVGQENPGNSDKELCFSLKGDRRAEVQKHLTETSTPGRRIYRIFLGNTGQVIGRLSVSRRQPSANGNGGTRTALQEPEGNLTRLLLTKNALVCAHIIGMDCIWMRRKGQGAGEELRAQIMRDAANHALTFEFCPKYNNNQWVGFNVNK